MNDQFTEILWGTFEVATRRSSLSRGTLYNLINDGLIRSRLIRRKNARGAGHRLIDLRSLDDFIENSPGDITDEVRERNRAAAKMMQKAKKAKLAKLAAAGKTPVAQRDGDSNRDRDRDVRRTAGRRTAQKEAKAA